MRSAPPQCSPLGHWMNMKYMKYSSSTVWKNFTFRPSLANTSRGCYKGRWRYKGQWTWLFNCAGLMMCWVWIVPGSDHAQFTRLLPNTGVVTQLIPLLLLDCFNTNNEQLGVPVQKPVNSVGKAVIYKRLLVSLGHMLKCPWVKHWTPSCSFCV